jgi:proteasome assembly chaperone (PAC2) family protein
LNQPLGNSFTYLHRISEVTLTEPVIVIQGLPGMGLIGKIAATYLIKEYNAIEVARFFSSFFPPVVQIDTKNGLGKLARIEVHAITELTPNLLILTGDAQPHDIGIIQVLNSILDYLIELKAKTVICLGGLRVQEDGPEIAGFGYSQEMLSWLEKYEIAPLKGGEVTGAVGVLSALAAERGLESYGLLGKLTLAGTDPIASKNLLAKIDEIYSLRLNLEKMNDTITDALEKNERIEHLAREYLDQPNQENEKGPGYYI